MKNKRRAILSIILIVLVIAVAIKLIWFLPSGVKAAWYNDGWGYREKFTIDHTKVPNTDQSYFVVLVNFTKNEWKTTTNGGHVGKSDGGDFIFTSSDGATKLNHEIETYNASTGQLVAWVQVPTVSHTTDTVIYIYYGNSSVADQWSINATWNDNGNNYYKAVWHLDETSGNQSDSTSNAKTGTPTGSPQGATGQIGFGDTFVSTSNHLDVSSTNYWKFTCTDTVTVTAWVNMSGDTPSTYGNIFGSAGTPSFAIKKISAGNYAMDWFNKGGGEFLSGTNQTYSTGTWYYVAMSKNGCGTNKISYYRNGATAGTATNTTETASPTDATSVELGNDQATESMNAFIDEVRVTKGVARSSDWITTEYNNQSSPSTFFKSQSNEEKNRQPVLVFHFDEGYGTTANDSEPETNTGTLAGSPTPTWQTEDLCLSGKCLYFNGTTASVTVANTVINVQSVSFWVRPKTNGETLLDLDGGTHYLDASGGTITAHGFSGPTIYVNGISGAPLVAGNWQNVTVTTGTAFSATSIKIGHANAAFLNGFVDEFKIYDYARTSAQVKLDSIRGGNISGAAATFGPNQSYISNGLTGYWKMEENTGTSVGDSAGGANTGTWHGTGTHWGTGKYGTATKYNGTDDYVTVAQTAGLPAYRSTGYSVSFWINGAGSLNGKQVYTEQNTVNNPLFQIGSDFGSGKIRVYMRDDLDNVWLDQSSATTAFDGTWHHVVWTDNNGTAALYIDGVKDTKNFNYTPITTLTPALTTLGANFRTSASNFFTGSLDELRTYNRVLNPEEAQNLYNFAPGPLAWWKLDENTGTTANDSSGNGYSGSFNGSTAWVPGKFGSGVLFNSGSYILASQSTAFDFGTTTAFSFEGWVKLTNDGAQQKIISSDSDVSGSLALYTLTNNKLETFIANQAGTTFCTLDSTNIVSDGNWHHVAAVYNRNASCTTNDIQLYIDGAIETTTVTSSSNNTNISIDNGGLKISSSGSYLDGIADNMMVYNYARSAGQIIQDMNGGHPAPGSPVGSALGHWKFDEGADNTCSGGTNDVCNSGSAGSALDGAESNMAVPGTSSSGWTNAGKIGKALNFDGTNDVVAIPANSKLNLTTGGTISAWIKPNSAGGGTFGRIVDKSSDTSATGGYAFGMSGNTAYGEMTNGLDTNQSTSANSVPFSQWTHVVWTFDGVNWKFYINGKLDTTLSTTKLPSATSLGVSIGSRQGATDRTFDGTIDDVYIYNFPLNSDQINVLYNQGASAVMGAVSTDSSGNASFSTQQSYCPPGNTEGNCATGLNPAPDTEYKFDENTGTSVYDTSGNGATGTWSGSGVNHWAPGKFGSAGNFNGTDDKVSATVSLSYAYTSNYTVEGWIKSSTLTASGVKDLVCRNGRYGLQVQAGGFRLVDTNGHYSLTNATFSNNAWHHVAAVQTGSTTPSINIYIDGILQAVTTSGTWTTSTGSSSFGINGSTGCSNNFFAGQIDNIEIFPYIRTPAQIAWDYNYGKPLGWWKMDEIAANTCSGGTNDSCDSSGNGFDLAWNGSATFTSSGRFNYATTYGGTSDYAACTDANCGGIGKLDFAAGATFSWGGWVKTSTSGTQIIGGKKSSTSTTNAGYLVYQNSSNKGVCKIGDATNDTTTSSLTSVNDGSWHNVFCVTDGTKLYTYVDGKLESTNSDSSVTGSLDNTVDFRIGMTGGGFNPLTGQVDDFRVYNYALSAQQVKLVVNDASAVHWGN